MSDTVMAIARRERSKADTDREIRQQARALLIEQGWEALTLRAIARRVGITAPALYRYYVSREDLIEHIRADICTDLADELYADLADVQADGVLDQVLAVCRSYRRWSIAHPQEFGLVFASPATLKAVHPDQLAADPFALVFLAAVGRVLTAGPIAALSDDSAPVELRGQLEALRARLLVIIDDTGFDVSEQVLSVGTMYALLKFWVRLYGQIALEVLGLFPFTVSRSESLFEVLLADLVRQAGLSKGPWPMQVT